MGCSVFLYLLLSGLCTLCPCLPRHYHFVSITKNWSEAQSYCREKYTDLATFDNEEEVKKAIDTAGSVAETAWIGLYDNISRWRWSMADRDFYREGETEFRNWKDGEPNNLDGAENCAETYKINNGKWFDTNCSKRNFFICYNGSAVSNQNYILVQIEKNWTEAQIHCREHYTDLVSVRNQAENEKIKTRNDELPDGKGVWIGLFRDSWKWSDQGNSSFRYWKPGQPDGKNENCVQQRLTADKRWENRECSERKPFFCYEVITAKRRVLEMKISSDRELRAPGVNTQVIQQLREELIKRGMSEDVNLHWRTQPDGQIFHLKDEEEDRGKEVPVDEEETMTNLLAEKI